MVMESQQGTAKDDIKMLTLSAVYSKENSPPFWPPHWSVTFHLQRTLQISTQTLYFKNL